MKDFLDKVGSNFFVAAFVPALGFIIACSVIFSPIIPRSMNSPQASNFDPLNSNGLLLFAMAIVLGFSLSSLNDFTNRFFQGDYLLDKINLLTNSHTRKAQIRIEEIRVIKEDLLELGARIRSEDIFDDVEQLTGEQNDIIEQYGAKEAEYHQKLASYKTEYPPSKAIRPTKFGNILAATEYYYLEQYGISRTAIWHCLIHVIPSSYYNKIDQSWNSLAFVLNCAVLSFASAALCFGASIYEFLLKWKANQGQTDFLYFVTIDPTSANIYGQRAVIYLILSLVSILILIFFYFVAVQVAYQYGALVRRSIDMFRFKLFSQFNLRTPKNSDEEFDMWRKLHEFMQTGGEGVFAPLFFEYDIGQDGEKTTKVHLTFSEDPPTSGNNN